MMAVVRQLEAEGWRARPICCAAPPECSRRPPNGWLVAGRRPPAPPASPLARDTAVLVASAARRGDNFSSNVVRLAESVRSARRVLALGGAQTLVLFDGLRGKPGVTPELRAHYASKILRARRALPADAAVVLLEEWLHQANAMRCALRHLARRPALLFAIQDDTQLAGAVDTQLLHRALTRDADVEYVRFASHRDCEDGRLRPPRVRTLEPCTAHPRTALLHRVVAWLDRPHFATVEHYERKLFSWLPYEARATPEQLLDQISRREGNWKLWVYGRRGDMLRDFHWPTMVGGRLVPKEELQQMVARGELNVTDTYRNSFLIHAYRSKGSQDVSLAQIAGKQFRKHDPLWITRINRQGNL